MRVDNGRNSRKVVKNVHKRGFVTIATGSSHYYQMAANLLSSYRLYNTDNTPFALICDRACEETQGFDDVVVAKETYNSYLDKLSLLENTPYEETIFVDADSMFLRDPHCLWEDFESMDDFCAYGKALPLSSPQSWFDCEKTGEYRPYLKYDVNMHGGLYYFRKTAVSKEIFDRAIILAENYAQYEFSHFFKPADEPVLALSMAISGCKPCESEMKVLFLPSYEWQLRINRDGDVQIGRKPSKAVILHFGSSNTGRFLYQYLCRIVENQGNAKAPREYWALKLRCFPTDLKLPLIRSIKRTVKYSLPRPLRKKVYMWIHRK